MTVWRARSGLQTVLLGASRHALGASRQARAVTIPIAASLSPSAPKFSILSPNTWLASVSPEKKNAQFGAPSNRRPLCPQHFLHGWQSGRADRGSFGKGRMLSTTAARRQRDHYAVLGIDRKATLEQVKAAYRKQAMLHHPDRAEGCKKKAEEAFKEISAAHAVLSDAQNRRRYDMHGADFENQFDFTGMHARNARGRPWEDFRGFDVHSDFEVHEMTQEEAEEIFAMFFGRGAGFSGFQQKQKPKYTAKKTKKKGKSHGRRADLDDILGHGGGFASFDDVFSEAFAAMGSGPSRSRGGPRQGKKRRKPKAKTAAAAAKANTSFVT